MHVLLVDDDLDLLELLKSRLESLGLAVLTAFNGLEAIQLFKSNKVRLILSDIQMPIMDGLELLMAIRTIDKKFPIYLMSSNPSYTEEFIVKLGATGYFNKLNDNIDKIVRTLSLKANNK